MTHTVYVVYGEAGDLLYVGCTSNTFQRYTFHESMSPWWHLMVWTRELGTYEKRDALDLETELIWTLGPLCNRPQVGDWRGFGLNAREEQGPGAYSREEQRAIRRRNVTDVPELRRKVLFEQSRDALNRLGDALFPNGISDLWAKRPPVSALLDSAPNESPAERRTA